MTGTDTGTEVTVTSERGDASGLHMSGSSNCTIWERVLRREREEVAEEGVSGRPVRPRGPSESVSVRKSSVNDSCQPFLLRNKLEVKAINWPCETKVIDISHVLGISFSIISLEAYSMDRGTIPLPTGLACIERITIEEGFACTRQADLTSRNQPQYQGKQYSSKNQSIAKERDLIQKNHANSITRDRIPRSQADVRFRRQNGSTHSKGPNSQETGSI